MLHTNCTQITSKLLGSSMYVILVTKVISPAIGGDSILDNGTVSGAIIWYFFALFPCRSTFSQILTFLLCKINSLMAVRVVMPQ